MRILRASGFFITTLLIYLGIPLLGWGLGDLASYFALAPRGAHALLVLLLGLAVGWQALDTPEGIRGRAGRKEALVFRQRLVRVAITLSLLIALFLLPWSDRRGLGALPAGPLLRWLGVPLFALGIGLVFWSGLALGRLYSGDVTLQEGHRLVTGGPYRLLRHPRYSGAVLLAFGLSLTFNSWIGLLLSVLFIPILLLRIRDEELLMRHAFGEEWQDYCRRTRRLIPFIY